MNLREPHTFMTPSHHGLPFFTISDDEEKVLRATMTPSEHYLPFLFYFLQKTALNLTEPHTLMTPFEHCWLFFTIPDDEEKILRPPLHQQQRACPPGVLRLGEKVQPGPASQALHPPAHLLQHQPEVGQPPQELHRALHEGRVLLRHLRGREGAGELAVAHAGVPERVRARRREVSRALR